jgi:hypothetical protein
MSKIMDNKSKDSEREDWQRFDDLNEQPRTGYKGFNAEKTNGNLTCKDYQYVMHKKHVLGTVPNVCIEGFHACECPVEVMSHYPPSSSRYGRVIQTGLGDGVEDSYETKMASSEIKVQQQYSLKEYMRLLLDHKDTVVTSEFPDGCGFCSAPVYGECDVQFCGTASSSAVTDYNYSIAWAAQEFSVAVTQGRGSVAVTELRGSAAVAVGERSQAAALDNYSVAATVCNGGSAETRGYSSVAVATHNSEAVAAGFSSVAVCTDTGGFAIATEKYSTAISTSGHGYVWVEDGLAVGQVHRLVTGGVGYSDWFRVDKAGAIVVTVYSNARDVEGIYLYHAVKDFDLGKWYKYDNGLVLCDTDDLPWRCVQPARASKLMLTDKDLEIEADEIAAAKLKQKFKKKKDDKVKKSSKKAGKKSLKNKPNAEAANKQTAYKGFDLKLTDGMFTSRNKTTFKLGKWKTMRKSPRVTHRGFHSSFNPFSVLASRVASKTRFTKVSLDGEQDASYGLMANSKLRVDHEYTVYDFAQEAIRFRKEQQENGDTSLLQSPASQVQVQRSPQKVVVSEVVDSILWARGSDSAVLPMRSSSIGVTEGENSVATTMGASSYAATLGFASVAISGDVGGAAETRCGGSTAVVLGANSRATTKGIDSVAVAVGAESKAECEGWHSVAVAWDQRNLVSVAEDSVGVVFAYVQESGDTISPFFKAGKNARIFIMVVNRYKKTFRHVAAIGGKDLEVGTYYRYGSGGIQLASSGEVAAREDRIELAESLVLQPKDLAKYSEGETNED